MEGVGEEVIPEARDEQHTPPPKQSTTRNLRIIKLSIQPKASHVSPRKTPGPKIEQDASQKPTYIVHLRRNKQVIWSVIAVFGDFIFPLLA